MSGLRDERRCYPEAVVGVNVGLAFVDGVIAFLAFYQLMRIHLRNSLIGWTRQKVFHLIIGSSNLGYFIYFVLTLVAACKGWVCWSHSCGFIIMAFPRILFVTTFLLLLSFWVDLCHQSSDDDEDEGSSPQELLLEKTNKTHSDSSCHRRCCTFTSIHLGSRQKVVILVTVLVFAIMITSSVLIWIGMGKSLIDSAVVAQVYVDLVAIVVLLLGGALACYGCWLGLCFSDKFYIKCFGCNSNKHTSILSLARTTGGWLLHLPSIGFVLFHRFISTLSLHSSCDERIAAAHCDE